MLALVLATDSMTQAADTVPGDPGYLVRSWETADGLPENSASAITQTPDGYLWLGTFNGLVRFNGVEFKVFNPANTPELPSAGIVNLHTDRSGRLLVSTYRGLTIKEGAEWRRLTQTDGAEGDCVRSFADRSQGDVLITTFNGKIFELSGRKLSELPSPPGLPGQGYIGGADEDGHWWVVQSQFIGRWENDRWVRMISTDPPLEPYACAPAHDGGLWLLLGNRAVKLRNGREVAHINLHGLVDLVWSLREDNQENLWIASAGRGFLRVTSNGEITTWNRASGWSDSGRCVFEDRERNLWLGTSGNGLLCLTQRRFRCLNLVDGPRGISVSSVSTDGAGGLWAATLGRWLFHVTEAGVTNSQKPGVNNYSPYVQSVLSDRAGRLWFGALSEPLRLMDQNGTRQIAAAEAGSANATALFEDSRGQIWIGSDQGIATCDGVTFKAFRLGDGLLRMPFASIAEDASGALWVASSEAVFRRDGDGSFLQIKNKFGQSITGTAVLKADRDGSMWLASADRSWWRWRNGQLTQLEMAQDSPINGVRSIVEDNDGHFWLAAAHSVVRVRVADLHAMADGKLAQLQYQLFDTSDGLPKAEFPNGRQPASVRDARGRLWFATSRGVAMIDPGALRFNDVPPPVQLEEIVFYRPGSAPTNAGSGPGSDREVKVRVTAPFAAPISLPAGSRRIEIRYAGLSFTAPEKVRYQVKLEGLDSAWREAEGKHAEQFLDLAPRDYLFRVRAANNDGVWNETGASLAFTVLPYYWQTAWFRAGTGSLLVVLGGVFAWSWSRKKVRLSEERERVAEERHRSEMETRQLREELAHSSRVSTLGQLSSALAHELSQPLAAILRNAEAAELVMKQQPPDLDEINAILTDIRNDDQRAAGVIERMRALLKKRKLELMDLSIRDLIDDVATLTRSEACERKVQVDIDAAPNLPLVRGDRIQLQQVLLNLFLNGMDAMNERPDDARRLSVRVFQSDPQTIQIAVVDTGSGLSRANLARLFEPFFSTKPSGLGLGLPISRTIVESHGGRLWAENNPGSGAAFMFTLLIANGGRPQ
ncbi:MAG TPA: two-component regulator propeller domain-containing protein [Verrucomicrobiota bacterium]|nr:two-component regulator propeller domain-containing protein [Verrucomicrobiota bacterium]